MTIKDLEINEATIALGPGKRVKHIGIYGLVIVRGEEVPVTMRYEYKDNGSYLANYKSSFENFLRVAKEVSEKWISPKPTPEKVDFNTRRSSLNGQR